LLRTISIWQFLSGLGFFARATGKNACLPVLRRLREALAAHAASRGRALFPPQVLTFNALLEELGEEAAVAGATGGSGPAGVAARRATRAQAVLAWADVLLRANLGTLRTVFPQNPPAQNVAWARGLAEPLLRLQEELRENDLGLGEVASALGAGHPDWARWQELAELERRQQGRLAEQGLVGALEAQRAVLARAQLPQGLERVRVLAVPDPRPFALPFLERIAESLPVEVCVYAPEGEAAAFDAWGRPIPDVWEARELALPDFAQRVRVCANPSEQAELLAEVVAAYREAQEGSATAEARATASLPLALSVVDPELVVPLEAALRERGLASYNPEGRARRGDRLHQLLAALAAFVQEDSFGNLARLARQPDVLAVLCSGEAAGHAFLAELDRIYERHLPVDLSAVLAQWPQRDSERADDAGSGPGDGAAAAANPAARGRAALGQLAQWRAALRESGAVFPDAVQAVLGAIFANRKFDPSDPAGAAFIEAAEAWGKCAREVSEALPLCAAVQSGEALDLALALYGQTRAFPEKSAGAVEWQGWLELIWEDAPHVLVAGLNEGRVPSSAGADLFLPEGLRAQLGLKTNAQRLAVDAYYLQAAAGARAGAGSRLDLLLGRVSGSGDPIKPSRLLLRCAEEALPERVQFLFRELPPAMGANVAWSRAWALQLSAPEAVPLPAHLPVTGLREWLKCPLRFYLSRVLKLRAVDPHKVEMDAMDFGTLCHAALEAMGREAGVGGALHGCTDAARLQRFLRERLDAEVLRKFGRRLSVPLVVQVESARQRLDAAAIQQAQLHAEGWRIVQVEREFELPISGLVFRGKIDRIDEHEASGDLRVIDYKTSEKAEAPDKVHLVGLSKIKGIKVVPLPEWRLWAAEDAKRRRAWADLQLPVYERACAGAFPGRVLRCGYFHLPKAVGGTGLSLWEDYTPEVAASAWACAEGVATAIARREFWPPSELLGQEAERDDFATLFQRGAAASIAWPQRAAAPETGPATQRGKEGDTR